MYCCEINQSNDMNFRIKKIVVQFLDKHLENSSFVMKLHLYDHFTSLMDLKIQTILSLIIHQLS